MARFYGALAFAKSLAYDPDADRCMATLIATSGTDENADILRSAWRDGYLDANKEAPEFALIPEPLRYPPARGMASRIRSGPHLLPPMRPISRVERRDLAYRWQGTLAFAKGIDRSPWHDPMMTTLARFMPARELRAAFAAWDRGWDDALAMSSDLARERTCQLDRPAIVAQGKVVGASDEE